MEDGPVRFRPGRVVVNILYGIHDVFESPVPRQVLASILQFQPNLNVCDLKMFVDDAQTEPRCVNLYMTWDLD